MTSNSFSMQSVSTTSTNTALAQVLRQAKMLHRAASSDALASALPVLRRLLLAGVTPAMRLPELHRNRAQVQRKHLLRLLAREAGYASWDAYRKVLSELKAEQLEQFDLLRRQAGYPNLWFASMDAAQQHARQHGGRVVKVGQQAVILDLMS